MKPGERLWARVGPVEIDPESVTVTSRSGEYSAEAVALTHALRCRLRGCAEEGRNLLPPEDWHFPGGVYRVNGVPLLSPLDALCPLPWERLAEEGNDVY